MEEEQIINPEKEPEKEPEQEPNTEEEENLSDLVTQLNNQHAEELAKLKKSYEAKISERDKIIVQLMQSEKPPVVESIADRVNKKHNFKKW